MKTVKLLSFPLAIPALALVFLSPACTDDCEGPNQNTGIPTHGLVAHYPLDGNANDTSGNGYHGVVYNAVPSRDRFGGSTHSYGFASGGDSIATSFPGIGGHAPRTVSFWARRSPTSSEHFVYVSYGHIHGAPEIAGSAFGCYLYFDDSLTIGVDVQQGAIRYDAPADDIDWHHYVYVVPNQSPVLLKDVKLYQDGDVAANAVDWWSSRATSENAVVNTLLSESLTVQTRSSAYIDDIRIYDRALSSSEIQQLYHENGWK